MFSALESNKRANARARARSHSFRSQISVYRRLPPVASRPDVTTLMHEPEIQGDKPAIGVFVRVFRKEAKFEEEAVSEFFGSHSCHAFSAKCDRLIPRFIRLT